MTTLFCCSNINPYRPHRLDHEEKFTDFVSCAGFPKSSSLISTETATLLDTVNSPYVVQLVRQVNYGPLESKRYFFVTKGKHEEAFLEVEERVLIEKNFEKLNSYKNFKCDVHNKFFEVNLYQKDPVNKHHWRANVARPANEVDL